MYGIEEIDEEMTDIIELRIMSGARDPLLPTFREAPGELRVSPDVSIQLSESIEIREITLAMWRKMWDDPTVPMTWGVARLVTKYGDIVPITVDPEMGEGTFAVITKEVNNDVRRYPKGN